MTETKLPAAGSAKRSSKSSAQKPAKPLTKVIVRSLPPTMTEETFLEQIQPIPDHDHKYFMPADRSLGVRATCRAYLNFLTQEDVFIFKEKFDGYVFVDEKGNEYPAVVEFAPYQRMGRLKSKKVDRKSNTYEKSEHFLNFLKSLDSEETIPKLELKIDFENKHNQIRSTPLLEYLNDKSHRKRDRERKPQEKKILAPIREDAGKKVSVLSSAGKERSKPSAEKPLSAAGKKVRPERSEKEKTRRAERDKLRREKFEEKKKERLLLKQQQKPESTSTDHPPPDVSHDKPPPAPADKSKKASSSKEVKKYSERRQEGRKKSTTESASKDPSHEEEAGSKDEPLPARAAGNKRSDKSETERGEKKESRRYSERRSNEEKRRIRNKDRPALQIYQPGKSRNGKDPAAKEEGCDKQESSAIAAPPQIQPSE